MRGSRASLRPEVLLLRRISDHTAKVDVTGLDSSTTYWYRFTAGSAVSPVGRTRTAPSNSADLDRLRFGVVSCSNWEAGYFGAYRHLAFREDLDAIIHLGDYIYEYGQGEYGARNGSVRLHEPAHEIISLADYRIRHAQYKTDPDLAALHLKLPFITTWDDHESADNAYRDGAENHTPGVEGDWADRKANSAKAYFEWMPVRPSGSGSSVQLYRRFRFGNLAEISMLDLRTYRDEQPTMKQVDDPSRTITGRAQMDWLTNGIVTSPTQWKVVGNPVMITPCVFPPLEPATTAALTELVGVPQAGVPYNTISGTGTPPTAPGFSTRSPRTVWTTPSSSPVTSTRRGPATYRPTPPTIRVGRPSAPSSSSRR